MTAATVSVLDDFGRWYPLIFRSGQKKIKTGRDGHLPPMQLGTMPHTAFVFFMAAICMAIAGFAVLILMLRRVNARLPKEEGLRMFIFDQNTILKAYKQHFPQGRLLPLYWFFLVTMFLFMFATVWSLGMLRRFVD